MKILLITLSIFLFLQAADAQSQTAGSPGDAEMRLAVKKQAEPMREALLSGEYEKILELMYPAARRKIPDEKKFIENARTIFKRFEAEGIKLISVELSEPEKIVPVGIQMFAVLPIKMRMRAPKGIFAQQAFDIAVSEDGGRTWKFAGVGSNFDGGQKLFKEMFPAAADKIKLPDVLPLALEKNN